MREFELPTREPTMVPAGELLLPMSPDLTFQGFAPEAFAILERLRAHPHIEQYRAEKEGVQRYLKESFKRYRDDLAVNFVLPNRLDFETEKNVMSRLLKNDFGAGGCHHHLWLSFYRPGRRRLTDFQLAHSIHPDGFTVGLYVGDYAKDLVRAARARIAAAPGRFLPLLEPLLQYKITVYVGTGKAQRRHTFDAPLDRLPDDLDRATGLWLRTVFPRDEVLAWGSGLVPRALAAVVALWPAYRFIAGGGGPGDESPGEG